MNQKPIGNPPVVKQETELNNESSAQDRNIVYLEGTVMQLCTGDEIDKQNILIKQEIIEEFDTKIEPASIQDLGILKHEIKEEIVEEPNIKTEIDDEPVVKQEIVWVDQMNLEENEENNFAMEKDCFGEEGTSDSCGSNSLLELPTRSGRSILKSATERSPVSLSSAVQSNNRQHRLPLKQGEYIVQLKNKEYKIQSKKRERRQPTKHRDDKEYKVQPDGSVVCKWCGEAFHSSKPWYRHKLTHHTEKPPYRSGLFACEVCKSFFKSLKGYKGHMKTRHSVAVDTRPADKNVPSDPDDPESCEDSKPVEEYKKLVANIFEKVKKECEAQGSVNRRGYSRRKTVMDS